MFEIVSFIMPFIWTFIAMIGYYNYSYKMLVGGFIGIGVSMAWWFIYLVMKAREFDE